MLVGKPARKAIKEGTQPLDVFFAAPAKLHRKRS